MESDKLPPTAPSSSYKAKNLIILNLNTKNSLAYELAHEVGHLLLNTANYCELKANCFAIRLICSYCLDTNRRLNHVIINRSNYYLTENTAL